jgi:uncharacterized membrane protein YhaH (DUF805 family)
MSDIAIETLLPTAALIVTVIGMGWLALSVPFHAQQVWGVTPSLRRLHDSRRKGACALCVALLLCMAADHASIAVLVWIMAIAAASLAIAFTLAWRPRWLRILTPWVRQATISRGD